MEAYPSGRMLIICFPMMRELLYNMLLGRTLFSEIDISLSKRVFVRNSNHPSIGSLLQLAECSKFPTSDQLTGILNINIPFITACTKYAENDVVSDHSSHGIRNNGTPNKNTRSIKPHFTNRVIECVSSSTNFHQSYRRHTRSSPYIAKVYIRWLGASTRLTGINGALDGAGVEVLGRLGRGDLTFGPFCAVAGLGWPLPGVEGNDDGRRGVPFMACSSEALSGALAT